MEMLERMHQLQMTNERGRPRSGRAARTVDPPPPEFNAKQDRLYAPKSLCLLSTVHSSKGRCSSAPPNGLVNRSCCGILVSFPPQLPAVACFERYIRQLYLLSQSDYDSPSVRLVCTYLCRPWLCIPLRSTCCPPCTFRKQISGPHHLFPTPHLSRPDYALPSEPAL